MSVLQHKVVSALPVPLQPNSIYYVRSGTGFDQYITNSSGVIVAYPANSPALDLAQTVGQSATIAMSQKAVTDALVNSVQPNITGSTTLNGAINNTVVMFSIVPELDLEVGDVIRIQTESYNKLHTVESITNNGSVIVNYEHAGNRADGSLKLPDFTGQATVTRIAKWFNAPIGLGQAWLNVSAAGRRVSGTVYVNNTGRGLSVAAVSGGGIGFDMRPSPLSAWINTGTVDTQRYATASWDVPDGWEYRSLAISSGAPMLELR